ncbi:RNA polymerase sigma factor, partial [Patulibacter sp.]|uniref:RNA polymerase sigma factor n=1 Tax=Patulibacter sp. TaxID=1912859 RepID=UPI002720C274
MPEAQPPDLPRAPERPVVPPRPLPRPGLDPARALTEHEGVMYTSARRVSLCDDDAHDAVQATAERFLRHQHRVDPETVAGWLAVVARREALRVRERRVRTGAIDEDDHRLIHLGDGPADLAAREEDVALAREALARLKPQERLALWMQAEGRSYDEIAEELSWTRTKVNRNITEGRARLRKALTGIALGEGCAAAGPRIDRLAAGDASPADLQELRPHLRRCAGCRGRLRRARGGRWSVLPPIVVAWLPWAGRGPAAGGAPSPFRTRVGEVVADRLALVLPAGAGAVTEAGLALTTGLAVAALGVGVVAGTAGGDDPPARGDDRRAGVVRPTAAPAGPAAPAGGTVSATPVAAARSSLSQVVASWSSADRREALARERASDRRAAERRAEARRRAAAR